MARTPVESDPELLDITAVAIDVLLQRGYDATSVDELADALMISRSTFFRRFKTKEDVVFADHGYLLERLSASLASADGAPFHAVNAACLAVLEHHLARPAATRKRHALLRSNTVLRDRELVTSHRYERVFRHHLTAGLDAAHERSWVPSAYAAAAVSVHNHALRSWLENGGDDVQHVLSAQLRELADAFLAGATPAQPHSRVLVAVYDSAAPADAVISQVRAALAE